MKTTVVAFILGFTVACGGSAMTKDTAIGAKSSERTHSQRPSGIGIAECDEYVRLVSQCIDAKVPESERADQRQKLDYFRKVAADPMIAAVGSQRCAARIRETVQYDSYGCYTEEAAKRGIQTACTLLARAELETALDGTLLDGVQDGPTCTYGFAAEPFRQPFRLTVHWRDGPEFVEATRSAQGILSRRMQREGGVGDLVTGAPVEGVGDEAFFWVAGIFPMLTARSSDVAVDVGGGGRDQMIAIARTALPRIQPAPRVDGNGADKR